MHIEPVLKLKPLRLDSYVALIEERSDEALTAQQKKNLHGSLALLRMELYGEERMDANETALAENALLHLGASKEVKRAPMKSRLLCPVKSDFPDGVKEYGYDLYDSAGIAELIAIPGEDFPSADVSKERVTVEVDKFGSRYTIDIDELLASAMSGQPITSRKMKARKTAFDARFETLVGQGRAGVARATGLFNNPNVPVMVVTAGSAGGGGSIGWGNGSTKTSEEVLQDLLAGVDLIATNTKETEVPDTLVLPKSKLDYLKRTVLTRGQESKSILAWFLSLTSITGVESWHFTETADTAGTGPAAFIYRRHPEAVHVAWKDEREIPVEKRNGVAIHNAFSIGGCVVFDAPLSAVRIDAISG